LDDLHAQLDAAGDNKAKLLNLRKRMARIRVFDPACGSGNFLVIAYKKMREIEAEINRRRGESHLGSEIPVNNFRGIELRNFPAEIARLALIIAEYQCDVLYRGQKDAVAEFLPLDAQNWIVCGNALRLDWLSVCPPTGTGVKMLGDDLFSTPLDQTEIDFENEGGETYICGNPPYLGARWQTDSQKNDIQFLFAHRCRNWKSLDYVSGWFVKACDYMGRDTALAAFVATNSVCQGVQVPTLWSMLFSCDCEIKFAHTSFKWQNLASNNAGVTVVIVGFGKNVRGARRLFSVAEDGSSVVRIAENINGYLSVGANVEVEKTSSPIGPQGEMTFGNTPIDGGHLLLNTAELKELGLTADQALRLTRKIYGSSEFIRGVPRHCLWITDEDVSEAMSFPAIRRRVELVKESRLKGGATAKEIAVRSHQFQRMNEGQFQAIVVPGVSSENRPFLPVGLIEQGAVPSNKCFALYDAPLWNMALIASRLHWVWIGTVCVRMRTDFSYSNTLGWNTFPVPLLTEQNKADLTACAENILLAREAHFPATIADLYDPETMPDNLRHAHERNDEVLERIYIGRRFKNDTERLEKLFELYTKMTAAAKAKSAAKAIKGKTTQ
jgi:hypothetical protein